MIKINCNKKVLTREFQDVNSEKLINMLGVVDDFYISLVTQDFLNVQILTIFFRGCIIQLVEEKKVDEEFFLFQMLSNN